VYEERALPHRNVVVDHKNVYKRSEGVPPVLLNHFWLRNDIVLIKLKLRDPLGENNANLGAIKRLSVNSITILVHERFSSELLIRVNKSISYI